MRFTEQIFLAAFLLVSNTVGVAQEQLSELTLRKEFEAHRESSSEPDLKGNGDSISIAPGESITLLDIEGPGIITHFWNTIAALDPFAGRSVVFRIYYDGNTSPSVQAPLGDFFGVGHGALKSFTSMPVTVSASGLSRTCYWRIPFRKHVRVTVTNESPTYPVVDFYYYLDWQKHQSLPAETMYFHAEYRQSMPAKKGHYTILETKGTGHYVGTVYSAQQVEMGWFGEGDDFIYIDGAKIPQLKGTGTEDYFNDAWGFSEFHTPYHGVSLYEGVHAGDRVTAYRWHIADPIPFRKSIRVTIEHRGRVYDETAKHPNNFELAASSERPDWLSSVGFWYQYPPATIPDELPPASERIAPYRVVPVQSLKNRAESPDKVHPSHVGVRYLSSGPGDAIEFEFSVDQPGRYQLSGMFYDSFLSGVFQPLLDGKEINLPIDMGSLSGGFKWHQLDLHDLNPGKHTLRFEQTNQKSAYSRTIAPPFTDFTIEYLAILRLQDMEGYHQLYDEKKGRR